MRALCSAYGASPNTIQHVLAALVREAQVETVPGRGSFVAEQPDARKGVDVSWQSLALGPMPSRAEDLAPLLSVVPPGEISLRGGYPDSSLQPVAALNAALGRACRRPGVWDRQPSAGNLDLRAWFAREASPALSASDALIVPGGQSGLAVAIRALCPPRTPLLVESPTYVGALAVARAAGVVPVPVPTDSDGVLPGPLEMALKSTGARVIYLQPTFANPSGALLTEARRVEVLALARAAGAFVIEDDYAHDLQLDPSVRVPPPLVARDPGRVVYIRSLTKSAAAGLRIAAVCSQGPVAARLRAARAADDLFVSGPLQEAALELVTSPAWPRHLRSLTRALRERRDAGVEAVRAWRGASLPLVPGGGYSLWVELPRGVDDAAFAVEAARVGVHITQGSIWFPAEPTAPFLRLSFAAADVPALREGISRLSGLSRGP